MFQHTLPEYYGLFLLFKVRALAAFAPETGMEILCVCAAHWSLASTNQNFL